LPERLKVEAPGLKRGAGLGQLRRSAATDAVISQVFRRCLPAQWPVRPIVVVGIPPPR